MDEKNRRIINALEVICQRFSKFIENIRKAFNELFTILNGVSIKNEKVEKETIKDFVIKKTQINLSIRLINVVKE